MVLPLISKPVTVTVGPPEGTSVVTDGGVLVSGADLSSGVVGMTGSVDSIWPVVGAPETCGVPEAGAETGAASAPSGAARSASETASMTLRANPHPPRDFNAFLPT